MLWNYLPWSMDLKLFSGFTYRGLSQHMNFFWGAFFPREHFFGQHFFFDGEHVAWKHFFPGSIFSCGAFFWGAFFFGEHFDGEHFFLGSIFFGEHFDGEHFDGEHFVLGSIFWRTFYGEHLAGSICSESI